MATLIDSPISVFVCSLVLMWSATRLGALLRKRRGPIVDDVREDLSIVLAAALTLLALVIGFTFSMALGRYDQRKICEGEEANAIGTEYVRANLLASADASRLQALLRDYLDNRLMFYEHHDPVHLRQIDARKAELQAELWSAILPAAAAQPTPVVALAVSGMNDVLNSQGYAQAAWWNRIPLAAWALLGMIAYCCNLLIGYCARTPSGLGVRQFVLPVVLAIALGLIADIEAPRSGSILIAPHNLSALKTSLRGP